MSEQEITVPDMKKNVWYELYNELLTRHLDQSRIVGMAVSVARLFKDNPFASALLIAMAEYDAKYMNAGLPKREDK